MRSVKPVAAGERPVLGVDMRRAISAAMTTKPATISRPITTTSTFNQSGAEACEEDGDAKKTS